MTMITRDFGDFSGGGGNHKVFLLRCVGYLETNRNFSLSQELMALNPKDALNSETEESASSLSKGLNLTQIIFFS